MSLRSTLWRLRRPGIEIIEATSDGLWLSSTVWVDVWESEALARRLINVRSAWIRTGREVECLTADLLPDWYEGWVLVERERLHQLRLHALESLCRRLIGRGEFADAVQAGLAAVAGDPLRESAHGRQRPGFRLRSIGLMACGDGTRAASRRTHPGRTGSRASAGSLP